MTDHWYPIPEHELLNVLSGYFTDPAMAITALRENAMLPVIRSMTRLFRWNDASGEFEALDIPKGDEPFGITKIETGQ